MSNINPYKAGRVFLFPVSALILALLLLVLPAINSVKAGDLSLADRIQRIEDEKQIRDLMIEYGLCLDRRDFAGYAALFAKKNGEWSGLLDKPVVVKGRKQIQETMEKAFADSPYDPEKVGAFHLVTNIKIDVEGDRGTGYSRWTVAYRNENDVPVVMMGGRYDDVYIREEGEWKFLKRSAVREIP